MEIGVSGYSTLDDLTVQHIFRVKTSAPFHVIFLILLEGADCRGSLPLVFRSADCPYFPAHSGHLPDRMIFFFLINVRMRILHPEYTCHSGSEKIPVHCSFATGYHCSCPGKSMAVQNVFAEEPFTSSTNGSFSGKSWWNRSMGVVGTGLSSERVNVP